MMTEDARFFLDLPVRYADVGHAEVAYRTVGEGPALLLVHGWPLWGFTWRKVLRRLSQRHTCYVVDLPGAGDTRWTDATSFTFNGQAVTLRAFVDRVGLARYSIMAHDTGGTIARQLALLDPDRVERLIVMDTEIPNHRPPLVELFQRVAHLSLTRTVLRAMMRSPRVARSRFGFGECFVDRTLIDAEFHEHFCMPLVRDERRLEGQIRYAQGIDWDTLDKLAEGHGRIHQPVLFLWGEDDPWFPVERAREMVPQMGNCAGFHTLPGKLLIHEESPELVAEHALSFLGGDRSRSSADPRSRVTPS